MNESKLGFFTIVGKESYKTFGVIENAEGAFAGRRTLCLVFTVNRGDGKCCCSFDELPTNCPKHLWKPFAFINTNTINVFNKYRGDASNDYKETDYEKMAKLFAIYYFGLDNEVVRNATEFLPAINCSRCGEWLTNPQSIRQGIGPVCQENSFR